MPMDRPEFFQIRLEDIPKEFIAEYNLIPYANNGWVYFEIIKECYGLPQTGMLANDLIRTRLNNTGYYETTTTPGLWRHKWRPIMFVLIVDDFVIEYVGNNHLHHLRNFLTNHYTIMDDLDGKIFLALTSSGITQKSTPNAHVAYPWRATLTTCFSSMDTNLPPNLSFPRTATAK